MIRTFAHAEVEELARHATVPVINGAHGPAPSVPAPGRPPDGDRGIRRRPSRTARWRGSATATTWPTPGSTRRYGWASSCGSPAPRATIPIPTILERAARATSVLLTRDPAEAAEGADVVTTDVWASMGQEEEAGPARGGVRGLHRRRGADGAAPARRDLPALPSRASRRGGDGRRHRRAAVPHLPEAENRLHAQKAILLELWDDPDASNGRPCSTSTSRSAARSCRSPASRCRCSTRRASPRSTGRSVRPAGLFDVSHMGEFIVTRSAGAGSGAADHHQRRIEARGRAGAVLGDVPRDRWHRRRPDRLSLRRPLDAGRQCLEPGQGPGLDPVHAEGLDVEIDDASDEIGAARPPGARRPGDPAAAGRHRPGRRSRYYRFAEGAVAGVPA